MLQNAGYGKMKKAQLKIQQMAFMLIVVTLFFVLVMMFVLVVKFSGLKNTAMELEEKNAMLLVSKIANSPEFSCGESFGRNKINCVDWDKLMILKENIGKYERFWGVSNIEIKKIYPTENSEVICDKYNYPECGITRIMPKDVQGFDVSNFVTLCRKTMSSDGFYDKCEVARIMASYGGEK